MVDWQLTNIFASLARKAKLFMRFNIERKKNTHIFVFVDAFVFQFIC